MEKAALNGDTSEIRFTGPVDTVHFLNGQKGRDGGRKTRDKLGSYGWGKDGYYYTNKTSFTMNSDWEEQQKLALTGWHAGTEAISTNLDNIKHSLEEEFSGYRNDVTGQFFDVGLVLSGEPECWFQEETQPTRKSISICINIAASGGVDAKNLALRGAAVLALVDSLQQLGCIVELTAVMGAESRDGKNKTCFVWWDFGTTPLDVDAAALTLAHAGFFRVCGFALVDCLNGVTDGGCTYCQDLNSEQQKPFNVYIPSGDLRNENGRSLSTTTDAAAWVRQQVEKLTGVED